MSTFKRNEELIGKVNDILNDDKLTLEQKRDITQLIRSYESTTFDKYEDRHQFYYEIVSDMTNDFGFDDDGLADKMSRKHPTIQQSFMRFVTKFIAKMANKTYTDGRNERSVALAKQMMANVDNAYLPCI